MKPDARLAVPAAAGWCLLAIFLGTPVALPWAAAACWILAVGTLALAWRSFPRRGLFVGFALSATLAGLLLTSAAIAAPGRWPAALVGAAESGAVVRGLATTTQSVSGSSTRFTAVLTAGTTAGERFGGSVPILVFGSVDEPVGIGTELDVVGTLGEADAGGSVAFLFFLDGTATLERAPPWILEEAGNLRDGFRGVATALPGDGGALLPGLAIGDTNAVSGTLDSAMKSSALSHLTAVSGANCAVIVGLVVFGGAALGLSRGLRISAAVVTLVGFVILVTPEPSVLRAAVMASLVLFALASGRPARGLPVLALAVSVLLVIDPWLARNFGFVLSVCATAGLLLLATPLARGLSRWIPMPLALLIAVPAAAQIACQPVLILLSPSIPTYGVVANVLAAPAAPVATVLGLVACLSIPVLPALGGFVAQLAWLPSAWIAAVAMFFSGLPGASLPWLAGGWGAVLVLLIGGLAGAVWLLPAGRASRLKVGAAACLMLVIAVYLGTAGGEQLRRRLSPPPDWVVASCDVGQGDAVLVRSDHRVALIDTGPDPARLEYCLSTLGVSRINVLVLTHFDLDHVGAASVVAGHVDRLLVGPSAGPRDDRVVQKLADAGATVEQVTAGTHGRLGELSWRVLWPRGQPAGVEQAGGEQTGVEPGNDASVAVEFSPTAGCVEGCFRCVFLGDLGEQVQERMLAGADLQRVDVVKVSHHGSRDQSARLYEQLSATVGLIGVGADNDYGHPTQQTLDLLRSTGTEVVRTDRSGLALLSLRDDDLMLWTEQRRNQHDSASVRAPQ